MLIISKKASGSGLAGIEEFLKGSKGIIEGGVQSDTFVKIKCVGGTGHVQIGRNSYINSGTVIYSGSVARVCRTLREVLHGE